MNFRSLSKRSSVYERGRGLEMESETTDPVL